MSERTMLLLCSAAGVLLGLLIVLALQYVR